MPVVGPYIYPATEEGRAAAENKAKVTGHELKEMHGGKEAVLGEEVPEEGKHEADPGAEGEGQGVGKGSGKAVPKSGGQRKSRKG